MHMGGRWVEASDVGIVDFDAAVDKPLHVRVECGHLGSGVASLVPQQEATTAIADLSLAPGGRARVAWEDLTP
jgi:hypothetical protein